MNVSTLKSLMRLFGIVANISKHTDKQIAVHKVNAFLRQFTNPHEAEQYLQMYDFHAKQYYKDAIKYEKRLSALGVKATIIAEEVKSELSDQEKILIVVNLLEILDSTGDNLEKGFDFIATMAWIFQINDTDYENCKTLVFWDKIKPSDESQFFILNSSRGQKNNNLQHDYHPGLNGDIVFLNTSVDSILFKYYNGDDKLYINDRTIDTNQCYMFSKGASIRNYKITPIYYTDVARELLIPDRRGAIRFQVHHASYRFADGEMAIQPFHMNEKGGQLIGIMGSSGAGKTTMLNLMNGNLPPSSGKILINGHNVHQEVKDLTGIIGYVPQDDLLIEELTVYQNLYYNAILCFKHLNMHEIDLKITRVLKDLELYDIKDLVVGNPLQKVISGGQRKRLNLALEFIREPSIFFIDEPTSGLSSNDANKLMDLLKKQALQGALMIVNIHQPSSDIFKQFDKIMVMDQGGFVIYLGNPLDATTYFKNETGQLNANESECLSCGNVNPEQVLYIIEQKKTDENGHPTSHRKYSPSDWYYKFQSKQNKPSESEATKSQLPESLFRPPGAFKQFRVFFERNFHAKLKDKQYLLVGLLEAPLLALVLAYFSRYTKQLDYTTEYIFFENQNLPVFVVMAVIVAMFLGLMVSAEQIIQDRKILQREQFLHLKRTAYLHSKIVFLFGLSAIQTVTFVIIGNAMLGIHHMTIPFALMLFSVACNANLLGLNISSGFRSLVTIYIFIPILLVPQLLLNGSSLSFDKLPATLRHPEYVPVVGDLMVARWAYEGMLVHQFKTNDYQEHFMDIDRKISRSSFMANYLLPELENKVANLSFQLRNNLPPDKDDWQLLLNELVKLEQFKSNPLEPLPGNVTFLTEELTGDIASFLKEVRLMYSQLTNYYITEKDNIIRELRDRGVNLVALKEDHVNNRLSDIVTAKNKSQKLAIVNNEIIRKAEPVFYNPESKLGRAHFYAPEKTFLIYHVETFWFNLIFIWIISIFLYIFLQLDVIRKVTYYFNNKKQLLRNRMR